MGVMLEQIGDATSTPHELTWVPEPFLEAQGLNPWGDFPSWIPGDPLMFVDVSASVAAGLTFRPLAETARDTLEFEKSRSAEELEGRQFGITREREREVLEAWHAAQR
jgi:2'-hydroxyisoflavone reductase